MNGYILVLPLPTAEEAVFCIWFESVTVAEDDKCHIVNDSPKDWRAAASPGEGSQAHLRRLRLTWTVVGAPNAYRLESATTRLYLVGERDRRRRR